MVQQQIIEAVRQPPAGKTSYEAFLAWANEDTLGEWLWQDPLPSSIRALAEIAGVDPAPVDAFERALRGEPGR